MKVFYLVQVYVFNFDLSEFSAAALEKGLLKSQEFLRNLMSHIVRMLKVLLLCFN